MDPIVSPEKPTPRTVAAFAVHVFTACGAACALLALIAAARVQWPEMFAWLGVALIIDGLDGTFARRLAVAQLLPRWSGDVLDFVVDFATYVFVPAYAVAAGDLLPQPVAIPLGLIITVTGALYFADRRMKTSDSYFRGFPALWNVAAFYLFVLKPVPWIGATAIVVLAAATFVPIHFVHPVRTACWRVFNLAILAAWAALATFALTQNLDPPGWTRVMLAAIAVYFVIVGLLRDVRRSLASRR
jgi:phosphatidylcholine synthase